MYLYLYINIQGGAPWLAMWFMVDIPILNGGINQHTSLAGHHLICYFTGGQSQLNIPSLSSERHRLRKWWRKRPISKSPVSSVIDGQCFCVGQ